MHGGDDAAPFGAGAALPERGTARHQRQGGVHAKRAARQATALFAFHDAPRVLRAGAGGDRSDPAEREQRQKLRLDAAGAALRAGLDQRACELPLLGARDARAVTATGPARGARLLSCCGRTSERDPRRGRCSRRRSPAFGDGDSHGRAILLALLATVREDDGSGANDAMGEEAIAMARRLDAGAHLDPARAAPGSSSVRDSTVPRARARRRGGRPRRARRDG